MIKEHKREENGRMEIEREKKPSQSKRKASTEWRR